MQILVDGKDITEVDAGEYRRQIGVVPQDPHLLSMSIADNIACAPLLQQAFVVRWSSEYRARAACVWWSTWDHKHLVVSLACSPTGSRKGTF